MSSFETDSYEVEHRLKKASGEYVWVLTRGQHIHDDQGRPVRIAGSIEDITERKEMEYDCAKAGTGWPDSRSYPSILRTPSSSPTATA